MEVKNCKTCGKQFLSETDNSYCRICNKKWYEKQEKIREQAENLKWQEQKEQERKLFEAKVQTYKPILMESVNPSAHTLYIIGNGFDLMHRVPSSYYNFRDSLGKNNSLRYSLETALTAEDIWADFENALGTLNLNLMGSRISSICGLTILGFMGMRIVALRSSIWLWKLQRHQWPI